MLSAFYIDLIGIKDGNGPLFLTTIRKAAVNYYNQGQGVFVPRQNEGT
jgi:hypothetical protein